MKPRYSPICDFSRGGLNARLCTRIQTLLRGHIWGLFLCKDSDFDKLKRTNHFC